MKKDWRIENMSKVISIGNQGFDKLRENNYFYVDKTAFLKEWWDSGDSTALHLKERQC